jgi:DNA-binding NarL/FixJ family response regulator
MPQRTESSPIHIAIVEDDVNFRNAMVSSLVDVSDIKLVGEASTKVDGMRMLEGMPVDVLLVDLGLPDGSGIDIIRCATEKWPSCDIMVCTTFGDENHVIRSLQAGAAGYLLKDSEPHSMLDEIRSLNAGGSPISPLIARRILMQFRQERAEGAPAALSAPPADAGQNTSTAQDTLSAREMQALELITKGFTAEEIAGLMQVSHHTVRTFVRRIYRKLQVSSRVEAIFEARNRGLLPK